jgi:predicted P-type ATPase
MAMVQSAVIIIGGLTVCLFQYRNEKNLYRFTHMEGSVQVMRDGELKPVPQADLVPGDVVMIEPGLTYCDMVLVKSIGVLVDESALTGESNPVPKTAVDPVEGDVEFGSTPAHKRNTIQAGCTILESEPGHNLAIVLRTGSHTAKGELLRNIFTYQRHQFKFDVEVGIVFLILALWAMIGFTIVFVNLSYKPVYAFYYGLYAVSSICPPLLGTVFTVSVGISDNRLTKQNIACTNSEDILVAGKVKKAFFDKTGTLTKQGLEFISARSSKTWKETTIADAAARVPLSDDMALGMATCHSLTRSAGGDLIGNPVDRTMFDASGASLAGNAAAGPIVAITDAKGNRAEILKHFDFDHHRMTQSVVVKTANGTITAFVKGSGESMQRICTPSSLPDGFDNDLRASAKGGIYQITMAIKPLDASVESKLSDLSRDDLEANLAFCGVVNFKNVLREETPFVIQELEAGEVRSVMITGDSVLTGVCIAKESGIIDPGKTVYYGMDVDDAGEVKWLDEDDNQVVFTNSDVLTSRNVELAVSGRVWENLRQKDTNGSDELAEHIRVFGRCTPLDKVSVVTSFVDRGFITLMCGDGGNDCGALKTAHVGIALSDAEASIVSPFTSLDKTITSVTAVLKEGRCALASALASYKFVILYGQITFSVDICQSAFRIMFSEWCWAFMDGVFVIGLGFTLPLSQAAPTLAPTRPTSSLLGPHTMSSVLGVLFIHYFWTIIAVVFLFTRDWFQCRKWREPILVMLSSLVCLFVVQLTS